MSLVDELHAARKARLERMGDHLGPLKIVEAKLATAQATIAELEDLIAHQRRIIRSFTGAAPTIEDIIAVVSEHYGLPDHIMTGRGRAPAIAFPRYVAYFLCRKFGYSLHQIGKAFKRDHTTAYYGSWQASLKAEEDHEFSETLTSLKTKAADRAAARVTAALEAVV